MENIFFGISEEKMLRFCKKCVELGIDAIKMREMFMKKHAEMILHLPPKDYRTYINVWADKFIDTGLLE